ncbi:ATP-binding protein [Thermopetrobacter sp. TC1]|uniref:ATP-binding protein n=1 Tax=Thermopetrobacter sp. TC1 TaxID=1495045 RepID=UPI00068F1402|nr:ATP-binding protein [Thermopetrobacter sp. TC1]
MTVLDPEQLKKSPRPAFLWDPARRRIAWANAAAVAWFNEDGLIELQERPFDAREPGVAALADLAREALANTAEHRPLPEKGMAVSLEFPSTGRSKALSAHAHLHALPDGRPGLLIVADAPLLADDACATPLLREVLDAMPLAVAAIDARGRLLYANPAAFELFDADALGGLSALFADERDLADFLSRARKAGVASRTVTAPTRFGDRRIRLLARPLDERLHAVEAFSLILEDITDRHAQLEPDHEPGALAQALDKRSLSQESGGSREDVEAKTPAKKTTPDATEEETKAADDTQAASPRRPLPLSEEDIAIFRRLSEGAPAAASAADETADKTADERRDAETRLKETAAETPETASEKPLADDAAADDTAVKETAVSARTSSEKARPVPASSTMASRSSGRVRPEVPPLVQEVLDHRPDPIILHRDGRFHYANAAARTLFGMALEDAGWDALTEQLRAASEEAPLALNTQEGVRTFHLRRDVFPWRDGALVQVTLFSDKQDVAVASREAASAGRETASESSAANPPTTRHETAASEPEEKTTPPVKAESPAPAADEDASKDTAGEEKRIAPQPKRAPVKIISIRPRAHGQDIAANQTAPSDLESGDEAPSAGDAKEAKRHSESMTAETAANSATSSDVTTPESATDAKTGPENGPSDEMALIPQPSEKAAEPPSAGGYCVPETLDEELRAILDTATDGIITLNRKGEILSFSAGAEALFGLSTAEAVGRPFADLLEGESRKVVTDYLDAIASGGHMAAIYNEGREVTARAAGGGKIPLFITIGKLGRSDEAERPDNKAAFCVVVRDITQWKKTESELRRAKEAAERSLAQKTEFLAAISHELRTPLNAILGFSDVMRNERFGAIGNEKYKGYANDIYQSGEHLLSLINDLLDLSRIEAGKFEMRFADVDVKAVAEEALQMMQEQAAQARVILRRSIPDDLPRVVADARALKQILLNLLSNAVKFTEPGGQVMLSARTTRRGELEIVVRDTGIGMSAEELERALQPFERITGKGRKDKPGTGLGLPLTKALTEANHARFEIDSEPGKGTRVRIIFPTQRVLA